MSRDPKTKAILMSLQNTAVRLLVILLVGAVPGLVSGAGPIYWDWPADRSFDELNLNGAALDRDGYLGAGLIARAIGPDGPEVFWRVVPDGTGGFYTGTGHGGELHHTSAGGKSRLVTRLEGTEIFSLLVLPGGDLLAGCGPEGHLYRIDREGGNLLVGTVAGGYVWAMVQDEDSGLVWLATGSPAGLSRFDPDDNTLTEDVELPAQNTLDLWMTSAGELLLATQGPGLIYGYRPGEKPRLLYETAQDEARQFIAGPEGVIFLLALHSGDEVPPRLAGRINGVQPSPPAALMPLLGLDDTPDIPPAALYRIGGDGLVEPWWTGHNSLMTATWSRRWGWLAGGELATEGGHATLHRLTPPRGSHTLARWAGGDVLDIMVPADVPEEIVICQAHPGAVFGLGDKGDEPRAALSPPLDGGRPVRWGRLTWRGEGKSGRLKWSVRGGNRSQPDESWTAWSDTWTDPDHALDLPPSRFLQWRVEFPDDAGREDSWRVMQVSVSAWQDNLAPVISNLQLEYLKDVFLGGMINGADNITQRFRSGLQAEFSRNAVLDKWAGPTRSALARSVRIFTWEGSDPNGDRLTYRLQYRRAGEDAWRPISTGRPGVFATNETLASWDTTEVPDGQYTVRLVASDRRDNPESLALETRRLLGPVVVDNTAPEVSHFQVQATANGFLVKCRVEDHASALAGAQVVLPDGSFERLDPVDRICDSRREDFAAEIVWPREGTLAGTKPWLVRVEARALGGNLNSAEGEVR